MDKIREIFDSDKLLDFWPQSGKTFKDNTEASIRFIMYASIAVYLVYRDYRYVYLGLVVIAVLLYSVSESPEMYSYIGDPKIVKANVDWNIEMPKMASWQSLVNPNPIVAVNDCVPGDTRPGCNINVRVQDDVNRRATG